VNNELERAGQPGFKRRNIYFSVPEHIFWLGFFNGH